MIASLASFIQLSLSLLDTELMKWEWMMYISMYYTSYPCFYFLQMFMLCKKEAAICTIHCVNLIVLLYLALNLEVFFKKCDFLEKFILFWTRSQLFEMQGICTLLKRVIHSPSLSLWSVTCCIISKVKIIVTVVMGMTSSAMGIARILLLSLLLLIVLLSVLFLFYHCGYYGNL